MGIGSHTVPVWHRAGIALKQPTTIEDLLDRVVVSPCGCWLYAGGDSGNGYARILRPGTRNAMAAHRYVYLTFKGEIPPGWHVDHLCRRWHCDAPEHALIVRRCVNPDHLEAVPHRVNYARRDQANGLYVAPERLDVATLVRRGYRDDFAEAAEQWAGDGIAD